MMQSDVSGLSAKQIAFLEALLSGGNISEAARAADVPRITVYSWLNGNQEFQRVLQESKKALHSENMRILIETQTKALQTLQDLMDPSQPATTRLQAAKAVVDAYQSITAMWNNWPIYSATALVGKVG